MRKVLLTAAFVTLVAQTALAGGVILVDRGLPSTGVNAVDGSGNADWSRRTNISNGDYDPQDPIWAAMNWGPPELAGDTFAMPSVRFPLRDQHPSLAGPKQRCAVLQRCVQQHEADARVGYPKPKFYTNIPTKRPLEF